MQKNDDNYISETYWHLSPMKNLFRNKKYNKYISTDIAQIRCAFLSKNHKIRCNRKNEAKEYIVKKRKVKWTYSMLDRNMKSNTLQIIFFQIY